MSAASGRRAASRCGRVFAGLPLVIEACECERLHAVLAYEFERVTTHVRLAGAGVDGLGEDVSPFREDGTTLHETRPARPPEGEVTPARTARVTDAIAGVGLTAFGGVLASGAARGLQAGRLDRP